MFNPSNVGLVAAFLVLGSTRVEPLDFWWAPFGVWMVALSDHHRGRSAITARLRLLGMSAAFWITLAVGIGVLAASGHCMTARWSFEPVCGAHFWWVIVTSPEMLIFLFFMITDPKTVPPDGSPGSPSASRRGRLDVLMAPGRPSSAPRSGCCRAWL